MQENIYSDLWGEVLHKKDVGKRVYLYDGASTRKTPALILDNDLMIDNLITFLKRAKLEEMK